MIKRSNDFTPRVRRSGKTVCATLAAAGLLSLAVAVTPAFAQSNAIPGSGAIVDGGHYNGSHSGSVTIGYTADWGTGSPVPHLRNSTDWVQFNSTTSITGGGSLILGELRNEENPGPGYNYAGGTISVILDGTVTIDGSIYTSSAGTGSNVTLTGGTSRIGGDIGSATALNNLNSFTVSSGATLGVNGNVYTAQAVEISGIGSLYVGNGTTFTGGATVKANNGVGNSPTIIGNYGQNNINLGGTTNITARVDGGNLLIQNNSTHATDKNINITSALETVIFLDGTAGNLTIDSVNGDVALNAGGSLVKSTYTGTISIEADNGAFTTGAATTISTAGSISISAINHSYTGDTSFSSSGADTNVSIIASNDFTVTGGGNLLVSNTGTTTDPNLYGKAEVFVDGTASVDGNITVSSTNSSASFGAGSDITSGGAAGVSVTGATGATLSSANGNVTASAGSIKAEVSTGGDGAATIYAGESITANADISAKALGADNNASIIAANGSIATGTAGLLTASATSNGNIIIAAEKGSITAGKNGTDGLVLTSAAGTIDVGAKQDITVAGNTSITTTTNGTSQIASTDGDIKFGASASDTFTYSAASGTGDFDVIAAKGSVTYTGLATTTTAGDVHTQAEQITYDDGILHNGGSFSNTATETTLIYKDAAVNITTNADKNISLSAKTGIEAQAGAVFNLVQSGTGFTYISADAGPVSFAENFTRTALNGDLTILADGAIGAGVNIGKAIVFDKKFSNDATAAGSGGVYISAKGGHIQFKDTAYHRGGQFVTQTLSTWQDIDYVNDLDLVMTTPGEGAQITTDGGNISFNSSNTSTSGNGFTFTGEVDDAVPNGSHLLILAGYDVGTSSFTQEGGNISFGHNATMTLQESGETNIITSRGKIDMGVYANNNTFNYIGEDGDLIIASYQALDNGDPDHAKWDRNVTINSTTAVDFSGGSGNTLIHAYEGNVYTFADYEHTGGTGDRRVFAVTGADGEGGYIREANFTAPTLGGGSLLWGAEDTIDLNISKDGQTIGNYSTPPAMEFDFRFPDVTGGVGMVAYNDITVYNSLDYKSGEGKDGLAGGTSDVSDQLSLIRSGVAFVGEKLDAKFNSASGISLTNATQRESVATSLSAWGQTHAMPKHIIDDLLAVILDPSYVSGSNPNAEDFWGITGANTDSLEDRLTAYLNNTKLDDYGIYLLSNTEVYMGKDFSVTLNGDAGDGQAGYVQAPNVITRGKTTFNTSNDDTDKGLTIYADNWNIMGGLEIAGNNLTVEKVKYGQDEKYAYDSVNDQWYDKMNKPVRVNPELTLQGRIDLYAGANRDAAEEYLAPNMFDDADDVENRYSSLLTWVNDPTTVPGEYKNDYNHVNNEIAFKADVASDPLGIFSSIISAANTTSFVNDVRTAGGAHTDAFLKADVLTTLGVEVFTSNGVDTNGTIYMLSTGDINNPTAGKDLEGINIGIAGTDNMGAGMYAARWNLGETSYEQAAITDSTLQQIFDQTVVEVEDLDNLLNPPNDVYGDKDIIISAGQLGAHNTTDNTWTGTQERFSGNKGYIGLGTEGNASFTYIQDGLVMEKGVDSLGFWKEGGTDSGIISYQALQSKIIFDQANAHASVDVGQNSYMNLQKTDFYGWMNVRDARTVMAASMYNNKAVDSSSAPDETNHNAQLDKYVLNQTTVGYTDLGYGAGKNGITDGIVWLESNGGLDLDKIPGLENLSKDAYNPFPDSPFFNLQIGYLIDGDKTKFGLKQFHRKDSNGVLANLSNQAPKAHSGMAWVIENAAAFDSLNMPAYAYDFDPATHSALANQYNNQEVIWIDEGWAKDGYGFENGNLVVASPDAVIDYSDNTFTGNSSYILSDEHIKFVELDDYDFQHEYNERGYEYDRHHSVENILYLSPTRKQYNKDLAQISSGGNLDAARMVNFDTMNNVFKMMAHRAAQRGWGLSASADCAPGSGLWGVANYSRTEIDGNFNKGYAGFDVDRYGATIGYDHQVIDEKLLMGGYFSYSRPELDGWGRDIKADDIQFGLYAQVALPYDFIINAGLAYGWQQYDLDRNIAIGRTFQNNNPIHFSEKLSADYNGNSFQFNLEFAKYFYFDNGVYLRPSLQYDYNRVDINSYSEHSKWRWNGVDPMEDIPSVGQTLSGTDFDQHIFRLGGTVGWINECKTFEAAAKVYWVHNAGDTDVTGQAKFNALTGQGFNEPFSISGAKYDRNQVLYGLDLKFSPEEIDWSFTLGFEGLSGDKEDSYAGTAGVLYQF